jgi:hypothetical protein
MNKKTLSLSILVCAALPSLVLASQGRFVGARSLGMGGTGVATVDDYSVQYNNPAALGFFGLNQDEAGSVKLESDNQNLGRKDWGLGFDFGVGVTVTGDLTEYLDELPDLAERLDDSANVLRDNMGDLLNTLSILDRIDSEENAFYVEGNSGVNVRIGHFAIGFRAFYTAFGKVSEVAYDNLGLKSVNSNQVVYELAGSNFTGGIDADPFGISYSSGSFGGLTPAQFETLRVAAKNSYDASSAVMITQADVIAAFEKIGSEIEVIGEPDNAVSGLVGVMDALSKNTSGNTDNNSTTVLVQGFGYAEVPVSYGFTAGENFAFGVNLKYLKGRVYGTSIQIFSDDNDKLEDQMKENFKETNNFGVDLSAMYRMKNVQFGILATNLNSPEFDGFTYKDTIRKDPLTGRYLDNVVPSVTLDPQVKVGFAIVPFETLMIEANMELMEQDAIFGNYKTQYVSAGLEWDAFRFLAIRAGWYQNLADSQVGNVITAGVGVNFWLARLDVGAAVALDKQKYEDEETPKEVRLTAAFAIDF